MMTPDGNEYFYIEVVRKRYIRTIKPFFANKVFWNKGLKQFFREFITTSLKIPNNENRSTCVLWL